MLKTADLIQIRRHLHQIPELALNEVQTQAYIKEVIQGFNQEHLTLREVKELPTALLVHIDGANPKRTIGYRTDIDALPVQEETGLSFESKHPGVMHACGHDIHMTVALAVLSYFAQNQPQDNMVFFFQPAEESENGGLLAYEDGVFEGQWRPDEFYGLHDTPDLPAGQIGCRLGTLFAGTTEVDVDFVGKGGHAAFPQNANDMIVAASQFINQIQTIISRSLDPIHSGVVTFGMFEAGTIRNVIAGRAHLEGTIRGLKQTTIEQIDDRIRDVAAGIARSYNCEVNLNFIQGGYLPVENDPKLTENFINYMEKHHASQFTITEPAMTGEDFGYLLSKIPGTMFWLGVGDEHPLHSAKLNPNEDAIEPGAKAIVDFLEYRMQEK
ncbi:N-acetyldiaminopimelate deacetylase [Convivina intestini]|uniref:N-acetyldiaminopimelate deacetylase n=1 Tax=Convivina intestini TaxID=1505726 RepID=A0A2U1D668_9LACO|nr:N-acetyldiaminopimelate deacetylase [Convivina intestini]PVY83177.1 N-acetyldiaminopimelate deacetylase [Convivina intestini]CAH1856164.1 N-acetyldiaminopimelate deacetylase [Convivina intestini]SDB96044.1 N-acetyldiaminopimelate deacetylase [Leuconostocaceae bacterium R-53105]